VVANCRSYQPWSQGQQSLNLAEVYSSNFLAFYGREGEGAGSPGNREWQPRIRQRSEETFEPDIYFNGRSRFRFTRDLRKHRYSNAGPRK
jgi:hypothetical protein